MICSVLRLGTSVLPERIGQGAVAMLLCATQTSTERFAAGERAISWVHLQAQG
ncbi:MAG: hypothetical protein RLZZ387_5070 [Chloroflexota bacterium]|jgi:hypothetical protein